jgi:hypothetical protein
LLGEATSLTGYPQELFNITFIGFNKINQLVNVSEGQAAHNETDVASKRCTIIQQFRPDPLPDLYLELKTSD